MGSPNYVSLVCLHLVLVLHLPLSSFQQCRDRTVNCVLADLDFCRALYIRPDPYLTSDAVFGVKDSLIENLRRVTAAQAKEYGVPEGTALVMRDFVLVSNDETQRLRDANALKAMADLFPGKKVKLVDHLPVPDLD